ncbi:RIP metalloprotease RseP [Paenibacillus turpanensis]|uniref:RIP metalloprotease RseP n=1 Tax=Paenibacillus turpanensis TaxID=2689078 RepID=UPI00140C3ECF|nr:RIP metalloprotease RseP [Paenibacillus turpanensis]
MFTPQVILQIILMFFVLVTLHEWGHFYFAKRAGILVREFAIGFGPKVVSFRKGETRYTLRLLPIGGYVRMAGEDPEIVHIAEGQTLALGLRNGTVTHLYLDKLDDHPTAVRGEVQKIDLDHRLFVELDVDGDIQRYPVDPQAMMVTKGQETQIAPVNRQFGSKTVGQRALAIFAGPFMNFILAFVLFVVFMFMSGIPQAVKLGSVEPDTAASEAGLMAGDVVVAVNGETVGSDPRKLVSLITDSPEKSMTWTLQRNGETIEKKVTPRLKDGKGYVGIRPQVLARGATFPEAIKGAWTTTIESSEQILIGFKRLVLLQFKLDDLGGPVRIVEVTGEYAAAGLEYYIFWTALFSLYLGLFNLLPFPALDGSRLLFIGLEALRGKPIDPNRESMVHFIGFAMLMLLMIAVTYNDILRLFRG